MSSSSPHRKPLVQVTTFPLPPASTSIPILLSGLAMLLSSRGSLLGPRSFLRSTLDNLLGPRAVMVARWVQRLVFWFLFSAHTLEAASFAFVRLRRHGVQVCSVLGLKWLAAVFVGGKFAWAHFDDVVARQALGDRR